MILTRTVSVKLKNGKIVTAHYTKECRDVVVDCDDSEFFGTESIDTTDYSVEQDALLASGENNHHASIRKHQ